MEQMNFKRLKAEDDREYIFDYKAFKREMKRVAVAAKKAGDVPSIETYKEGLAQAVSVSVAAVKQWESGRNGVSDIERVREIASYLGLSDYRKLLVEVNVIEKKGDEMMMDCRYEEERTVARKVFHSFVDIIKHYKDSCAYAYCEGFFGMPSREDVIETIDKVEVIIQKARFDLPVTIYEALSQLFFEITGTLPEEIEAENDFLKSVEVDRRAEEYFNQLCKILEKYMS